ncbi:unnamed protein product [Psylliodes chrysocephalus]|uniref:Uncharacterized protein n=1 Tax=Psylliodes chrysocephalus TaxID=3402493 RepID=A0A9P0CSR5_9CUCU|nr:unnamed protein product [Psylliodes chrysocephala]
MKVAVSALIFAIAMSSCWAATTSAETTTKPSCTCPNLLTPIVDLLNLVIKTLQPVLKILPLSLGAVITAICNFLVFVLKTIGTVLSGGLIDVSTIVSNLVTALGGVLGGLHK